jgi:hypothetical protein
VIYRTDRPDSPAVRGLEKEALGMKKALGMKEARKFLP